MQGDLFPRIRKALKNESSIPRCSAAGILYFGTGILSTAWDTGGGTLTQQNMRVRAVRTFSTN